MNNNLFKYLLMVTCITASIYALDDENKDLNLIAPTKLNKIEGKKEALEGINKKEIIGDYSSVKISKANIEKSTIDVSNYEKVKLIDVVLETLSHADLLKSAREKVIQYELKLKNAIADYYPTINAEYNHGKTRSTPGDDDAKRFKYFKDENYSIVLNQNLYSGGATYNNIKSVEKKLEVAKNQYQTTLDSEIKKAIKAYFGVVFANRSVMVNERNMKKLKKILEIVTIKYDNGAASIGDLTSIKANVANTMTKLVKVNSKFVEALRYYEYIVGVNFEKTLPYEKNFDVDISSFDELYKRALEKNKDLINYYKSIEDEKFIQKKSKAAFRPKVDLELSYTKTTDEEDMEEDESALNAEITLSYNIFNGGKDKNKVLESNSKIRDLYYKLSEEKKKLKWNLSKIYTSLISVSQALESTITEVKASRKMVSSYWDAFKLGEQDLNTLLQGQRQLNTAETELVNYEKSNITDFFNTLELTGDLSSFFDVDPDNVKFIDFSNSDYKKSIYPKDGDSLDLNLKTGKEEKKEKIKKDLLEESEVENKIKDIPLPKVSINENINKFLKEFLSFDDESYMIEISSFGNIYDSFSFIKENNFDTNSFSYDVVNLYNIETKIAHNNFKTILEAEEYLKALEAKNLDKNYSIKKVKDIKLFYNKYIDGLKVEVKKQKPKIKIVEKIRQAIKKEEFKTNIEFKNKFLNADDNNYTINISSFTNLDSIEKFVLKNEIYDESFFFRYGDNGQLIKLVFGIYENYNTLEGKLKDFNAKNENIFPIVEKISFVKNQFNNNLDFNLQKEEEIEYEYINLSKKEAEKIKSEKKNLDSKKVKELDLKSNKNFEKEFLLAPKNYYSLFLASFNTVKEAEIFISNNKLEDNSLIILSNNKKLIVMNGIFKTHEEAILAVSNLDNSIKRNNPFIQKIFRTQESYIKNNLKIDNLDEIKIKEDRLAKLADEKKQEELRLAKLAEEKKAEELRLAKIAEEKKQEELRLAKLAEEKRLTELKKQEELRLKKLAEEKKQEELRLAKLADEKKQEELRLAKLEEEKKQEELRLSKLEEEKRIKAEELAKAKKAEELRLVKLAEEKRLTELKKQEELRLKKLAEEKKQEELRLAKIAEEKRIKAKKAEEKKQEELRLAKIAEEKRIKAKKAEELRLAKLAEEKKQEELRFAKLEEEKKAEELRLAKLEEEKKQEELRLAKLEEEKRIKAEELAKAKITEELRLSKLEEEKKQEELRLAKIAEEKRIKAKKAEEKKQEELRLAKFEEEKRIKAEELAKAKITEELRLAKLEEEKKAEELRLAKLADEKKLIELKKQKELKLLKLEAEKLAKLKKQKVEKQTSYSTKEIEEIDFANGLKEAPKKVEIPYSTRLSNFKKKFYSTSLNNYTLKLTTIDSDKVKWYAHRFGLDPNYVVIVKKGNKSTLYYGIFNSINEAKKKTETLHPLIYESKPLVKKIGSVR